MKKLRIKSSNKSTKSSNKNTKSSVDDIKNKVIKEIRTELMTSAKEPELSDGINNTESTPVIKDRADDNAETTPKKRGRKKKEAEPIKENDSLSVEDDIDYSQIKKPKNTTLTNARKAKNDEFYTRLCDVENELNHYSEHFKDKVVLCNCDDPTWSAFWKYFHIKFDILGLKKLIGTHFENKEPHSYAVIYKGGNDDNTDEAETIPLEGNGDFRSNECLKYLKECDIVATNPPFSLFREFISVLIEHSKKFVIVGDLNSITYKEVFPLILGNKIWSGYSHPKEFGTEFNGGEIRKFGNKMWLTNLEIKKRYEDLILIKTYSEINYPKYDNYDAINVDKVKDIPMDYDGVMGVPLTFIDKHNPNQFEIVSFVRNSDGRVLAVNTDERIKLGKCESVTSIAGMIKNKEGLVGNKATYARILIRRKHS